LFKEFIKNDNAVVGVIVAVLIAGLVISVISILQLEYVPKWMEEKEAEHMEQVANQFSQLKSSIDVQAALNLTNIPIVNSITLGSRELPYLMSVRSFGNLEIINSPVSNFKIDINNGANITELGIIRYSSANGYYINQDFIYECGALITSQADGNMISNNPSILFPSRFTMTIRVINITGIGGKISSSGFDTTAIQTKLNQNLIQTFRDVSTMEFYTDYPEAWFTYLNRIFESEGVNGNDNTDGVVSHNENDNFVTIDFTVNHLIRFEYIDIFAQIGPGWVE
jgi:hypothetical protein